MKELRDYKKQDEYYTPAYLVEKIVPYLKKANIHRVLCPFDNEDSEFVRVLSQNGFVVDYSTTLNGGTTGTVEIIPDDVKYAIGFSR